MGQIFEQDTKFMIFFIISCVLIYTVNPEILFYYLCLVLIGQILFNYDSFVDILKWGKMK
jgi:hypothetical protein